MKLIKRAEVCGLVCLIALVGLAGCTAAPLTVTATITETTTPAAITSIITETTTPAAITAIITKTLTTTTTSPTTITNTSTLTTTSPTTIISTTTVTETATTTVTTTPAPPSPLFQVTENLSYIITQKTSNYWYYSYRFKVKNLHYQAITLYAEIHFLNTAGYSVDWTNEVISLNPGEEKTILGDDMVSVELAGTVASAVLNVEIF